jgi:hypothetical protein
VLDYGIVKGTAAIKVETVFVASWRVAVANPVVLHVLERT